MYSLSKYRGEDGAQGEGRWYEGEGEDGENREKYRGSLEYPFEYD